jgi:hypothetical protein
MDNLVINEMERNDQYVLGILSEMDYSIALANLNNIAHEIRKQRVVDAILPLLKANYSLTARNSGDIELKFAITLVLLAETVKKYRIKIDVKGLVIELLNDIVKQIYLYRIARSTISFI